MVSKRSLEEPTASTQASGGQGSTSNAPASNPPTSTTGAPVTQASAGRGRPRGTFARGRGGGRGRGGATSPTSNPQDPPADMEYNDPTTETSQQEQERLRGDYVPALPDMTTELPASPQGRPPVSRVAQAMTAGTGSTFAIEAADVEIFHQFMEYKRSLEQRRTESVTSQRTTIDLELPAAVSTRHSVSVTRAFALRASRNNQNAKIPRPFDYGREVLEVFIERYESHALALGWSDDAQVTMLNACLQGAPLKL